LSNSILYNLFSKYRGLSRDSGGTRELSSGIISDRIRNDAIGLVKDLFKDGRLVEVGCGEGLLLEAVNLSQDKSIFFGVDRESKMIERAMNRLAGKKSPVSLLRGIGNMLPLRNESIDMVVCVNTFYNQPSFNDVVKIIGEMARICKTGGYIVFDIRNSFNPCIYLAYRYVMLYDPTCKALPLHTHSFIKTAKVLNSFGLRIVKRKGVFSPSWLLAPAIVFGAHKVKV